jgi:hypothetical protein
MYILMGLLAAILGIPVVLVIKLNNAYQLLGSESHPQESTGDTTAG